MNGLAARYLSSKMWAISPEIMDTMGKVAVRDFEGLASKGGLGLPSFGAVAARSGVVNQAGVEMRGDVAVIPVTGVISRYANMFEAICGGTSTQTLATKFNSALDDAACSAVVLVFDTPGGEANGINELAEMIFAARARKPIVAYVGGYACSAGYWLASACTEVVIDATAFTGSLGTVQTFQFRKGREDVETLELVSSQSPYKRADPRTPEGREKYQATLDEMCGVFVSSVARYRGQSTEAVLENFGQGWSLMGASAVAAGMADRVGSLESVIKERSKRKGVNSMSNKNALVALSFSEGMAASDVIASLAEHRPDVIGAITGSVAAGIPEASELATSELVAMLEERRPDAVEAIKSTAAEVPVMAIDKAADVVKAAAAAGVPELSAQLLAEGVTLASATSRISFASSLRDVLSASGMDSAFSALLAHESDPLKMLGVAIHEAKAVSVSGTPIESETGQKVAPTLSATEVYASRKA